MTQGREVAVTGSIAYDYIMTFPGQFRDHILPDKLHVLNVSFLVDGLKRLRGGCAANIAYSCALHGLKPRVVASAGSDFRDYKVWLEEQGVDTSAVRVHDDLLTASCFITTDKQNNQITGFFPGAMARAHDVGLKGLPGKKPALAIVAPNDPGAMKRYPDECRALGIPYLYDPGQQTIALSGKELESGIKGAKAVVMNDYECAVVSEKTGRSPADMLELAEAVIVTLGEKGSRIHARGESQIEVGVARPREIVDPTGCGDAYRGGLVRGILAGLDWDECGMLGALTGTFCIETRGPTGYRFAPDEFGERFEESFGKTCPAV